MLPLIKGSDSGRSHSVDIVYIFKKILFTFTEIKKKPTTNDN